MKKMGYLPAAAAVLAATGLLFYSGEIAQGVRAGLQSCAGLLIPSLFPFMILAALVGSTGAGQKLSGMVCALLTPLTGLPKSLGAVFFMSMLGGFPVGARMLSQLLEQKQIDRETAARALCCSVNAGPSFLITAVGAGMLGNKAAGLVLLGAQLFSSLCLAALEFRGARASRPVVLPPPTGGDPFVQSVRSAASGMLGVCAFVIAFSALSALLNAAGILPFAARLLAALFPQLGQGFFAALLGGLLEVTNGCLLACALQTREGFVLCAFLISFSSMSILSQVKSCFAPGCGVCFARLYRSRLTGGLLSALFALIAWQWLPQLAVATLSPHTAPLAAVQPNMLVTAGCLMAMFSILLLCPPRQKVC